MGKGGVVELEKASKIGGMDISGYIPYFFLDTRVMQFIIGGDTISDCPALSLYKPWGSFDQNPFTHTS
jgi:hypothetical protein